MRNVRYLRQLVLAWCSFAAVPQSGISAGLPQNDQSGAKTNDSAVSAARVAMAESAAQINKLAKIMAGRWDVVATLEPTAAKPKASKDTGTNFIVLGPGGLSLVENYHTEGDSGSRAALGVIWWDGNAQGYRAMFCDNWHSTGCSVYNGLGRWEGDDLVFQLKFEEAGKKLDVKEVLSSTSPSSFATKFYTSQNGGPLEAGWTVKHTKKEQ